MPASPELAPKTRTHGRLAWLLVAALLLVGTALGLRVWWSRARPSPKPAALAELLGAVAAQPDAAEPRVALAQHLLHEKQLFGAAMELSLLPSGSDPELRLAAAEAFLRLELPEKGLPILEELQRSSTDPALSSRYVKALQQVGRFPEALRAVETARQRFPQDPHLRVDRLRALLDVADYDTVLREAAAVLAEQPGAADVRILLAWAHLERGNAGEAVALLAALPDPAPAWADVLRGRASLALGRPRDLAAGAAAFQSALRSDPSSLEASTGLSEALLRQGDLDQALPAAERAAALRDESPQPWRLRERIHTALRHAPEAAWCRGAALLREAEPAAAVAPLQQAVAARAEPRFVLALARAYLFSFQMPKAVALLKSHGTRTGDVDLLRLWYDIVFEKREFEEAVEVARLISRNKEPRIAAMGHALVGQARREARDYAAAEAALDRALALAPNEPVFLAERAHSLIESSDAANATRAEEDLLEVIARDPALPPPSFHLATLRNRQRRPVEAYANLLQHLTLLRDSGLDVPLVALSRTCTQLKLTAEAKWCASWATQLKEAQDRYRIADNKPPSEARDRALVEAGLRTHKFPVVRDACRRLVRRHSADAALWRDLALACQRLTLYDERAAAMARWRQLTGSRTPGASGRRSAE